MAHSRSRCSAIIATIAAGFGLTILLLLHPGAAANAACSGPCSPEQLRTGLANPPAWAKGLQIRFMPSSKAAAAYEKGGGKKREPIVSPFLKEGETESVGPLLHHEGTSQQFVPHATEVHIIFWGKNFTKSPGASLRTMLLTFFNNLSGSAYQGILTQYFDSTGHISPNVSVSSFIDERTAGGGAEASSISNELEYAIAQNGWTPSTNAQYIVVPAPGSSFPGGGGYCGYHGHLEFEGLPVIYSFVPYAADPPFANCATEDQTGDPIRATSMVASHEYAEAATDPQAAWYTRTLYEIADICLNEGEPNDLELPGGAWAQNLFDNSLKQCTHAHLNPAKVYGVTDFPTEVRTVEANINAFVNPEGLATTYYFEYGTSKSYGLQTPEVSAGAGMKDQYVTQTINGLSPNTKYHYRIVVSNSTGTVRGYDYELLTGTTPTPIVVTGSATNLLPTKATLNGTVNINGSEAHYHFEYGPTTSYGTSVPIPSGWTNTSGVQAKSQTISGLQPETTYHYRFTAKNLGGYSYGADSTFTTAPPPITFGSTFGSEGSTLGKFNRPVAAAVDAFDNVWVVDRENNRVEHFSRTGETLTYNFGSKGSGNGQFSRPLGVALDPENRLWVTDADNHRVQRFNLQGEYLTQFGTAGSGNGQFTEPSAIAITPAGNIWVADAAANRLQEFTSAGAFIRAVHGFGYGGSGNGEMLHPQGLASDPGGNIWVADTGNNRIQKLSPTGEFISKFGTAGSGNAQFLEPYGIAVDNSGRVLVVDKNNSRVQELLPSGELRAQFGSKGTGNEQFSEPQGIVLGRGGAAYIVDTANNRVVRWNQAGKPEAITYGGTTYSYEKPGEITLEGAAFPRGVATSYQIEYGPTVAYGTSVPVPAGSLGSGFERVNATQTLTGMPSSSSFHCRMVATSSEGTSYGVDVYFTTPNWTPLVKTLAATNVIGKEATLNGTVNPAGATTTYHFDLGKTTAYGTYVTGENVGSGYETLSKSKVVTGLEKETTYHYRMVATNSRGDTSYANDQTFVISRAFEAEFSSAGGRPSGIAVDPSGDVLVADNEGSVQMFTGGGTPLGPLGKVGTGNGEFKEPLGVAITSGGVIWVTDTGNHRVEKFGPSGEYLSQFGTEGTKAGQFLEPSGIAVAPSGLLWVADRKGNRIQEFTTKGAFVREVHGVGFGGSGNGEFSKPIGIATDASENLWVADSGNNRVQEFSPTGEYIRQFGTKGSLNGQLIAPSAVTLNAAGNVMVVDGGNSRVQVFTPTGGFINKFGSEGTGKGAFLGPQGIALGAGGVAYISDTGNNRVQRWG